MKNAQSLQIESTAPLEPGGHGGPPLAFWAVGIALNLALIAAFIVWALRQGKLRDRRRGKRND